jgi:hypothetical protein
VEVGVGWGGVGGSCSTGGRGVGGSCSTGGREEAAVWDPVGKGWGRHAASTTGWLEPAGAAATRVCMRNSLPSAACIAQRAQRTCHAPGDVLRACQVHQVELAHPDDLITLWGHLPHAHGHDEHCGRRRVDGRVKC